MHARTVRSSSRSRLLALTAFTALVAAAASTAAQQDAAQVVENLNRDAMEAYNALDINKAGAMLEEALRVAYEGRVAPPLVARTHVNLGVIFIGGVGDQDAGLNSFVQAVCTDPNVQLDPLTSTPDIQNVFAVALERARAGACPTGAAPDVSPARAVQPPPPDQAIAHQSPPEQLSQTPLPLYAEISPLANAHQIFVYYRGVGMKEFKKVPMYQYQGGFAYQISCSDVFEPKVSYYIEAQDENGRVVGVVGLASQPIEVPVVAARTQPPPALPAATPPESCAARECPPGIEGCEQPGTAAIGDECSADAQCQSGLECLDDECRLIGAGGTEVPEYDPETGEFEYDEPEFDDPNEFSPTYVQVGFAVGLAYVQAGMVADRPPPASRVFVDQFGNFVEDPYAAVAAGQPIYFPEPQTDTEHRLTAWVPDANSFDSMMGALGGRCSADAEETGPMHADPATRQGLIPSRYCVRVKSPGFVPNMALRAAIGHFITSDFALAAVFRFQFEAGEGTLPNMLVGARGEYMLTSRKSKGLMISLFGGATFGEIQAQPPADGGTEGAPFARSGLFGVHAGAAVRYRFTPNFGLFAAPEADLQLPTILFNVDLTLAGVEAAF